MYVLLTIILATLAVWVIVYNILSFWIKKLEEREQAKEQEKSDVIDDAVELVQEELLAEKLQETVDMPIAVDEVEASVEEKASAIKRDRQDVIYGSSKLIQGDLLAEKLQEAVDMPMSLGKEEKLEVERISTTKVEESVEEKSGITNQQQLVIEELKLQVKALEKEIRRLNNKLAEYENKNIILRGRLAINTKINHQGLAPLNNGVRKNTIKFNGDDQKEHVIVKKPKSKTKNNLLKSKGSEESLGDIIELLKRNNVEYIDKRDGAYTLYIIGGRNLAPIVKESQKLGVYFRYVPGGWDITNNRSGWYAQFRVLDN